MKLTKRAVSDEIPTASMADIAFLLIVYFMVTATFAATRGLDFAFPPEDDSPPEIEKEEAVLIEVLPGGEMQVDGNIKDKTVQAIVDYLQPKLTNNPKKPVILKPDPTSPYGNMVEVLDLLRNAEDVLAANLDNLEKINISLPTQREIELFWY